MSLKRLSVFWLSDLHTDAFSDLLENEHACRMS